MIQECKKEKKNRKEKENARYKFRRRCINIYRNVQEVNAVFHTRAIFEKNMLRDNTIYIITYFVKECALC